MKPWIAAGAGVVLLAAGWTGVWFWGKAQLNDEIAGVLVGQTSGVEITYDRYAIGGFPFGYSVDAEGVVLRRPDGHAVSLPTLTVASDGFSASRFTVTAPERFEITLPAQGPDATDADVLTLDVTARDLVLRVSDSAEGQRIAAEATGLSVHLPGADITIIVAVEDVTARTLRPAAGGATEIALTLARLTYDGDMGAGGAAGGRTRSSATYDDVALDGWISTLSFEEIARMALAGEPGGVDLTWQTGPSTGTMIAPGQGPGIETLDYATASGTGRLTLADGRIEAVSDNRNVRMSARFSGQTDPTAGTVRMETFDTAISGPLAPTETPRPMGLSLSLTGIEGDEAAWTALDPQGALTQTPARLVLDLVASGRLTRPLDQVGLGGPPYSFANVTVAAGEIDALGASARVTGDLELIPPINLPLGQLDVLLTGIEPVFEQLRAAGHLDTTQYEMGKAMLLVYARPGVEPGTHTSAVTFSAEGMRINGRTLQ